MRTGGESGARPARASALLTRNLFATIRRSSGPGRRRRDLCAHWFGPSPGRSGSRLGGSANASVEGCARHKTEQMGEGGLEGEGAIRVAGCGMGEFVEEGAAEIFGRRKLVAADHNALFNRLEDTEYLVARCAESHGLGDLISFAPHLANLMPASFAASSTIP